MNEAARAGEKIEKRITNQNVEISIDFRGDSSTPIRRPFFVFAINAISTRSSTYENDANHFAKFEAENLVHKCGIQIETCSNVLYDNRMGGREGS